MRRKCIEYVKAPTRRHHSKPFITAIPSGAWGDLAAKDDPKNRPDLQPSAHSYWTLWTPNVELEEYAPSYISVQPPRAYCVRRRACRCAQLVFLSHYLNICKLSAVMNSCHSRTKHNFWIFNVDRTPGWFSIMIPWGEVKLKSRQARRTKWAKSRITKVPNLSFKETHHLEIVCFYPSYPNRWE